MKAAQPGAALQLYRAGTRFAGFVMPMLLKRRLSAGKEDPERHAEKLGRTTTMRPDGPLIWLHCASVGEFNAAFALIRALAAPGRTILVTTVTLSSAQIAAQRLPPGAIHQFAPFDSPAILERFLMHWRPALALMIESEIWPNTILRLSRAKIPVFVVNGRLSDRSQRRWRRLPFFIKPVLGALTAALCQTEQDAARFSELGASRTVITGNLKFDAATPSIDQVQLEDLRARIGGRPVFLAASVHPGEEEAIIAAHLFCREAYPNLLTIIAPRHPDKAEIFREEAARHDLTTAMRGSFADKPTLAGAAVHVVATLGELGLLYSVAHAAFVGGSLIPHGGQNPIEPARLDVPILFGPHIGNFAEIYAQFEQAGAALPVANAQSLGPALQRVLSDLPLAIAMQREAARLLRENAGALDRTLAELEPALAAFDFDEAAKR
jgi:3-deoxy-D-manno-octulosonic-acid transferase